MRADVVGHSVLPLKTLLADGALERLLVRMGQLVAVQVVDVAEGLAAHLASMVLLDWLGRLLGYVLLRHVAHRRWRHDARRYRGGRRGEDACYCGDVGGVTVILPRHGGDHGYHCRGSLGGFLWPRHHLDAGVTGLVAPQMVTVTESLVAIATNKRCFAFVLLLYDWHWWSHTSPAGHIVFEEIGGAGRRLLVYLDGQDRFLVNWFVSSIEERQQAVLGHLVLVVKGFIRLLGNTMIEKQKKYY